jgi:hypothetical protein
VKAGDIFRVAMTSKLVPRPPSLTCNGYYRSLSPGTTFMGLVYEHIFLPRAVAKNGFCLHVLLHPNVVAIMRRESNYTIIDFLDIMVRPDFI